MRTFRTLRAVPLVLALAWLGRGEAAAQDRYRVGLSFGGTGFIGVVAEKLWQDRAVEVLVTTFSFHDVSISAVAKQYFGASWLKPAVGAGLWYLGGSTPDGPGHALIARFPLGADWRVQGPSHLTLEVNVARGLWVRRPDPTDRAPMSTRMIPIPALSYRAEFH